MKVVVAEKCGFCLGVRRAISLAEQTLEENGGFYSFGPIIHNADVVEKLAQKGLKTVDGIDEIESGRVLIRSHGATRKQIDEIKNRGLEITDATCVLVKRVQNIANDLEADGYQVVIVGDHGHPEVQAIRGSTDSAIVVDGVDEIAKIGSNKRLGVICQTTQSPQHFGDMVSAIMQHGFAEIKVVNTLCGEAIKRQESAAELCKSVDVMFVLGGKHSANTKKLAELCKKYNNNTFHLQNKDELDEKMVSGMNVAGVTAGASTPDWVIREFVEELEKL